MATSLNVAARNAVLDGFRTNFDGGTLKLYTGTEPSVDAAATGTLLATFTLPTPAFNAASNGVASLASAITATAVAGGTAGYYRIEDSAGTLVIQGPVIQGTAPAADGDLALDNPNIASGQQITINSYDLKQP